MAEYITLTKRVKYAGDVHTELLKAGWGLEAATLFVNNIPDADATEVVRCEKCEWGIQVDDKEPKYCCTRIKYGSEQWFRGNDFCSYGKRRPDNGKNETL